MGECEVQEIVDNQSAKDINPTAYFKANEMYPEARDLLYQDFSSKFVWIPKQRKWQPRQQKFALGCMYYAHPNSGEHFYLRTLLTSIKGATSFENTVRDKTIQMFVKVGLFLK